MEFRCPHCNAPIYSRKTKFCGVCEKPLPPDLLLNDKQVEALKKVMASETKAIKDFDKQLKDCWPGS